MTTNNSEMFDDCIISDNMERLISKFQMTTNISRSEILNDCKTMYDKREHLLSITDGYEQKVEFAKFEKYVKTLGDKLRSLKREEDSLMNE